MSRPLPNLAALLAALLALVIGAQAHAACTAANPLATVIESTPSSAFTDHGNGTVTHALTGLMWKQCAQGLSGAGCASGTAATMIWSVALNAAVADQTAGFSDWRLPNKKELESIVELCGRDPAINLTVFPATPASTVWSSSSYAANPSSVWVVSFATGSEFTGNKSSSFYVRLVRGGQPFDSFDAAAPAEFIFANGFE